MTTDTTAPTADSPASRQDDYQIALDSFQGPFDLLFYLIRRAEVDIHDIPIAAITDQYLEMLRHVDSIDVELAGEFLVMASTLIEIKSRSLAPEPREEDGDGTSSSAKEKEDPRFELVKALLAYQRYRIASEELDDRRVAFEQQFSRKPARQQFELEGEDDDLAPVELEDVHVMDLAEAYERIASSIDFSRLGDHHVEFDDTPIELHEQDLLDRLERSNERVITLQSAFSGQKPAQRIGLFLATLELTRMRRIVVRQEEINEDIVIELIDDPDAIVVESDAINRHDHDASHDDQSDTDVTTSDA